MGVFRLLSLAVLLGAPAIAQEYRGQIRGTILNPEGQAAAGVSMRITHEPTGESRTFVSDVDGRYAVPRLLPGTYRIETAPGFEPATALRTSLAAAQDLELDIRLGLTSIGMTADVPNVFVPFERQFPGVRTRVNAKLIDTLPLDGRNFLDLALLAPGVTPGNFALAANGTEDPFTSYYVDASYDTEPLLGTPAARVAIDPIQELDVETMTFDATKGRSAGAQVNLITRSGTNQLQGGAFTFFQTDAERIQPGGFAGGPLASNRTFLFGSYQFTHQEDLASRPDARHLLSLRADQLVDAAHITGRYTLDGRDVFDRRGQQAGVSVQTPFGGSLINEVRFGLTRVSTGHFPDVIPMAESATYQVMNATTWAKGTHVITAGAEWYGLARELDAGGLTGTTWGLFVQDDWRALRRVTINAGLRFDRALPEAAEAGNMVSPRLGVAWTVDREAQTVLTGGYGRYNNLTMVNTVVPHVDGWTLGLRRQIGRRRVLQGTYVATRGEDLFGGFGTSRYDALQVGFEQRAEPGISGLLGYTYGKWTEKLEGSDQSVRAPLDSRHRLAGGFVVELPFGHERLWFRKGVAAHVLGNMALSGIFTFQSGRPAPGVRDEEGPSRRNLDVALLKNIGAGGRTLQLRFEGFNLTGNEHAALGRRYQIGGRFLF